ncbi:DUF2778 domain-containing protein [Methylobacterium durans]|uniref:DUF2778 domain-containing protein n=1 Tax=Methylobacterium durans TaxID=2202825 RepID=UPI002AFF65CD|nr:DUF2778 domain-containing protein [Methylobacterium durans]MEA1833372.1 DUF2778 domain-containing protein [Methylobacterium durans]
MVHVAYPSGRSAASLRRRRLSRALSLAFVGIGVAASLASVLPEGERPTGPAAAEPRPAAPAPAEAPIRATLALAAPGAAAWMLDPKPLSAEAAAFAPARRAEAGLIPPPPREPRRVEPAPLLAAVEAPRPAPTVPLPVPRPPEFRRLAAVMTPRQAGRTPMPSTRSVFSAATAERPFFERMRGGADEPPAAPALAYAAPQRDGIDDSPRARLSPAPSAGAGTAIYDISAARVYLPGGEVLEAHSGLGASLDNPRHVHLRMRGSTPPGTYDLTERERLFHGVRAIRLNPVGGSAAIHGRDGILAHTYMLGPSGASNGCVVFRQYDRFLQAFLRGEVRRLVVVAGSRQDGPPAGGSRIGLWDRLTGRAGG